MAPRKPKAAGDDDPCPTLKLTMEKGPLGGQTFDFKPGPLITIGRIVRGNTISIKDAGISSKHLLIQVEATPDSSHRHWTVTDLGTSNGTVLNDASLEPSAILSDGDVIKIGEQTSIRVKLEDDRVENEVNCRHVRRNPRRGARARVRVVDLGVIDELSELGLGNKGDERKRCEEAEIEVKQERNVNRNSEKNENGLKNSESTRRTRSSRKEDDAPEIVIDLSVIEGRRTGKGGRGRRKLPVNTISEETEKEEERRRSETGINNANAGKETMVVDLGNMNLGQWFEFLEVYLPQQIIEETEAKIGEMRRKAERFHEFMLEQKKAKG